VSQFKIEIDDGASAFRPGQQIAGGVSWENEHKPAIAELRLFWYTRGFGTQDIGVVATHPFENAQQSDQRPFSFTAPEGPYSYSGKAISIVWALELVVKPGMEIARVEIVISPTMEPMQTYNSS
jgi:hypothetical protein